MKVIKPTCIGQQEQIAIVEKSGIRMIPLHQVVYCSANGNYTVIHTINGTRHVDAQSLGNALEQLEPYGFVSIHKSFAVNVHHIYSISRKENSEVVLADRTVLKVSRRKKPELLKILLP